MAQQLKARTARSIANEEEMLEMGSGESIEPMWVYLKSEADAVIAELNDEIHKLKRALYKACANWAKSERYTEATWHGDEHREDLWANVQTKCRAKAEEYK